MRLWQWVILSVLLVLFRVCYVLWRTHVHRGSRPPARTTRRLAVMLGSGGHTAEMLRMLAQLDMNRYTPRLFIVSAGDAHSARLAHALMESKKNHELQYDIVEVPRARKVLQPLYTTPLSASRSLLACFALLTSRKGSDIDVVLMNGPGTCVPICLVVFCFKIVGCSSPRLVYVESLARAKRPSLTAKLVQPLVDVMLVQWPALETRAKDERWWRAKRVHTGWLQ